jgi:hypothetical protein
LPQNKRHPDYFGDNDLIFFDVGNADDLARKISCLFSSAEVAETVKRGSNFTCRTLERQRITLLNAIWRLHHEIAEDNTRSIAVFPLIENDWRRCR